MDPQHVGSAEKNQITNKRSVEVTVNRIHPQQKHQTDINNNQARHLVHQVNQDSAKNPASMSTPFDLPVVSLCFAALQVTLYFGRHCLGITDEKAVCVSWETVVKNGEPWRLLYAQFFHFGRVHIFFNVVTLMGIGRSLEKKIRSIPYAVLIFTLSAISNLLYIFLTDALCSGAHNEYTVGFSTAMFSLRMVHIFTMDSTANNGRGDPNLIFGFFPMHLPPYVSPWQPVIETIFFDIFVIGRCVASTVSGMCAGLIFPFLMKRYRNYIMLPRNPPPPPPRFRPREGVNRALYNRNMFDNNNNYDDDSAYDSSDQDHMD